MKELYSKAEDCYFLAKKIQKRLANNIDFYGSIYDPIPTGKYLSSYRRNNGEYIFNGHTSPFYFKFSENEFLRIGVSAYNSNISLGESLAALSDFYETLCEEYGEPTFFYSMEDDDEKYINLQWSFVNVEEEIMNLKNGTYFDDGKTDILIIFGDAKTNSEGYNFSDLTKKIISNEIGLPFELLYLVDADIENYIKHKSGQEISNTMYSKTNGAHNTSLRKKLG